MALAAGTLDRRLRIERPIADESLDGAGSGTWELVAEVWAQVRHALPSRGERLADGINLAARPARVRIRYRTDVTPNMRFVMGTRVMTIVAGPAEIGRHELLEFMVETDTPAGSSA